jgi:hypothetical protein
VATIRFKAKGKWVTFGAKTASKGAGKRAAVSTRKASAKRKGTWPKGKVPKHLKKYLFR